MTSLSVFKWGIFQGKRPVEKKTKEIHYKISDETRGMISQNDIPWNSSSLIIMHVRWNMIYWLTQKEISKNYPAFQGYTIISYLLQQGAQRVTSLKYLTFFHADINQSEDSLISSWLLIGLNLYKRMWINQKRSRFCAPCCENNKEVPQVLACGSIYFLKPLKSFINETIQKNPSMQCFLVRVTESD